MAEMICTEKKKPTGKRVLLYSGGMDSVMLDYLLKPDILLYFAHNQKYQTPEMRNMPASVSYRLVVDARFNLGESERPDAIIPNRNAYFVLGAAEYGETIYMGSLDGDRSFDKDYPFFHAMTHLLNHTHQGQHWCDPHTYLVTAPYKDSTKTELLQKYLSNGGDAKEIATSWSCYDAGHIPCGVCKPCFRKWVAMFNNGIGDLFKSRDLPWEAKWLPELLPSIQAGTYRGKEDRDTLAALQGVLS